MSRNVECVKVVVRCRPLSPVEVQDGRQMIVNITPSRGEIIIKNPKADESEQPKAFTFDLVYDWNSKQETVYKETAFPIVESVLEGYNGTIFAYGQTGTGKTHTMEGQPDPPELRGIIPRAFEHVFQAVGLQQGKQFLVRASFLELYNEEIRDLLSSNPKNKLELREKPDVGVYVKDLSSFPIQDSEEMISKLQLGRKNRAVGETKMNRDSSRSHSIFTITVEASDFGPDGENHIRMGKLNLVDLAGSERQSKTQATGDRFKEAININQSLTTLGNVISALVDPKATHIPYRDSKLTRLLQDSLGGNTKTVMVANIGPADWNYDETLSTLRYANRAKSIKNKPKINEDPKDAMLREFQEEIARLKQQLEQFQGEGQPSVVVKDGKMVVEKIVKVEDEQRIKELEARLHSEKEEIARRAEEERKKIEEQKHLAEEEKAKLLENLKKKEEEDKAAKDNQQKLLKKLKKMEEKLIVGTQAMEQAMQQEKNYLKMKQELEEKQRKEAKLAEELAKKEEENIMMEKKYHSTKDEIEDKKKKLQRLYQKYQATQTELTEKAEEFNFERQNYQEQIRELARQIKLKNLIIDHFIPQSELNKLELRAAFSEEMDDWVMPNLHLSGNSLKGQGQGAYASDEGFMAEEAAFLESVPNVYFVYTEEGIEREDNLAPKEKKKRLQSAVKKPTQAGARKKVEVEKPKEIPPEESFPKAKGLIKRQGSRGVN